MCSICAWNVNSDRRVESENGYAFGPFTQYKFVHRIAQISDLLKKNPCDILVLFELDVTTVEMANVLMKDLGYTTLPKMAYAPQNDGSMFYLVGYKPTVTIIGSDNYWFTSQPTLPLEPHQRPNFRQNKVENCDSVLVECKEEFEKGTFFVTFKYNDTTYILSVNHFGLRVDYKIKSALMLQNFIEEMKQKYDTDKVIVMGDFNIFPNDPKGLLDDPMFSSGFTKSKQYYLETDNVEALFSFVCYPYDLGLRKDPKEVPSILDMYNKVDDNKEKRMFLATNTIKYFYGPITSLLDLVYCNVSHRAYLIPTFDFSNLTKEFLCSAETGIPMSPSDHLPSFVYIDV